MARRRRLIKRYRRNPDSPSSTARAMPVGELWGWIGPGFGAFAAARFVTYLATGQIEKRKPAWGKHAGAIAAIGTFVAAWILAHRVKWLKGFAEPIVIGTGIAGAQSLVQLYLPKVGWMLGDPTVASSDAAALDASGIQQLPAGFSVVDDDPTAFEYNDAHDPGIYAQPQQAADGQPAQPSDTDLFSDLEIDPANQMGGIFS